MKKEKVIHVLAEFSIILLIGAFGYPGVSKLFDRKKFKGQLDFSPLLPDSSTGILSWTLPLLLIGISGLLCIRPLREKALQLYSATTLAFTVYIIAILTVAPFTPCSCIGFSDNITWTWQLVMNITLLALAFSVLRNERKRKSSYAIAWFQRSLKT